MKKEYLSPFSGRKIFPLYNTYNTTKEIELEGSKKEKEEEKENWRAQRGSIRRKIWKPEPSFLILKSDGIDFRLRKLHLRLDSTRLDSMLSQSNRLPLAPYVRPAVATTSQSGRPSVGRRRPGGGGGFPRCDINPSRAEPQSAFRGCTPGTILF